MKANEKIRVGIIGIGNWGRYGHVPGHFMRAGRPVNTFVRKLVSAHACLTQAPLRRPGSYRESGLFAIRPSSWNCLATRRI